MPAPFHLAIPVNDLVAARAFYGGILGCREGRSAERWVDWDFFGHQVVTHMGPANAPAHKPTAATNPVDGHDVPVPHFGVVLSMERFHELAEREVRH